MICDEIVRHSNVGRKTYTCTMCVNPDCLDYGNYGLGGPASWQIKIEEKKPSATVSFTSSLAKAVEKRPKLETIDILLEELTSELS